MIDYSSNTIGHWKNPGSEDTFAGVFCQKNIISLSSSSSSSTEQFQWDNFLPSVLYIQYILLTKQVNFLETIAQQGPELQFALWQESMGVWY